MTNAFLTAPPSPSVMARTAQKKVTRPVHLDYQSFWTTEETPGWLDRVLDQAATWLRDRFGLDFDLSGDADTRSKDSSKRAQTIHRTSRKDRGARLRVWNTNRDGTFVVTIMAVETPRGGWLQITVTASDPFVMAKKPAIADMLLDVVDFEDVTPLRPEAAYTATGGLEALESLIGSPDRRLPTIVAAPFDGVPFDTWNSYVNKWTRQAVGIAHVASLDPAAADEFVSRHGSNAVRPGTLRTYPAGADLSDPVTARTARWLSHQALAGDIKDVERTIEAFVRQHVASQPVPLPPAAREWLRAFDRIANGKLRKAVTPDPLSPEERRKRLVALQQERIESRLASPVDREVHTSSAAGTHPLPVRTARADAQPAQLVEPDTDLDTVAEELAAPTTQPELARLQGEAAQLRNELATVRDERDAMKRQLFTVQDTLMLEDLEELTLLNLVDEATKDIPDQSAIVTLLETNEALEARIERLEEQFESEQSEKAEARNAAARLEEDLGRSMRETSYLRTQVKKHDTEAAFAFIDEGAPQNPLGECPATWEQLIGNKLLAKHKILITAPVKRLNEVSAFDADGSALNAAWDAFGTLAAYRSAVRDGDWGKDVHDFCESAPQGQFHVPPNKHARGETSATKQDARYKKARSLPVPESVDKNGAVYMWSHFKPYTWAAEKRLRIHYYDQVNTHDAIYVGHIGQHLPSASTPKVHR